MKEQQNAKALVMFGPKACGKTRFAKQIAAHFGIKNIADNWDRKRDSLKENTLHICVEYPGSRYPSISFQSAMHLAGAPLPTDTHFDWHKELAEAKGPARQPNSRGIV